MLSGCPLYSGPHAADGPFHKYFFADFSKALTRSSSAFFAVTLSCSCFFFLFLFGKFFEGFPVDAVESCITPDYLAVHGAEQFAFERNGSIVSVEEKRPAAPGQYLLADLFPGHDQTDPQSFGRASCNYPLNDAFHNARADKVHYPSSFQPPLTEMSLVFSVDPCIMWACVSCI